MSQATAGTLLSRRLERLRQEPGRPVAGNARPAEGGHAAALAAQLGGRVAGPVVAFEAVAEVCVDRDALGRLPQPIEPDRPVVCLDLETTGLATAAGTLAFLVGLGYLEAGKVVVRQLLLPDHADEPAFLAMLAAHVPRYATVVTYNGKSFDWPLLVARYRLHRSDPPAHGRHLDLLPLCRQVWRPRLGSARLATVEQAVCAVARHDDLPGALIPQRYFAYLRDRRPQPLGAIIEHNRQDIVSLALLLSALGRLCTRPDEWVDHHPSDLGGLARALARRGRLDEALACLEAALASAAWERGVAGGGPLSRQLATDRARLLGRLGRRQEQAAAWLALAQRGGPGAAHHWLHVARYREHMLRDYEGALEACTQARAANERARLWGRAAPSVDRDLAHRTARLTRRRQRNAPVRDGAAGRAA